MTVSTELSHEEYVGNGVTTDFDFRFRIFEGKHLVVVVADSEGNETTLKNGTDYTIVGAGSFHGGKVVLNKPLAKGWKILLERDLPVVQETDLRNQGKFFAEVHEDAFDYLTMLIQKALGTFSLSLRKPTYLSNYYDAKGNRIANVAPPKLGADAVNKDYVDNSIKDIDSKTLRVKDKPINVLPNTEQRANKILAFDDNGQPITVLPESGSASDVLIELKKISGASLIGTNDGKTVQESINSIKNIIVNVADYGVVGDGVTDNSNALQKCFNSFKNNDPISTHHLYQSVKFVFPFSKDRYMFGSTVDLPENSIIDFNGNRIWSLTKGLNTLFRLNLRSERTYRAHTVGFQFGNVFIDSERGFDETDLTNTDFDHLLYIDGGWIIRSQIKDINCKPTASFKSLVHFDLTHKSNGPVEAGVPDAIDIINVSAQFANGASYAISFSGDPEWTGTGSRCGNINFKNIYGGTGNKNYDWLRVSNGSDDFGVVRINNVRMMHCTSDLVFGHEHLFNVRGKYGVMWHAKFTNLNIEHNSDAGTGRAPMILGAFEYCSFERMFWYSEISKYRREPQLINILAIGCVFDQIILRDLGHGTELLPASFIYLKDGSSDNYFQRIPRTEVKTNNKSWLMSMFSVPDDTTFSWLDRNIRILSSTLSPNKPGTIFKISNISIDQSTFLNSIFKGASDAKGNISLNLKHSQGVLNLFNGSVEDGNIIQIKINISPVIEDPIWNGYQFKYNIDTTVINNGNIKEILRTATLGKGSGWELELIGNNIKTSRCITEYGNVSCWVNFNR